MKKIIFAVITSIVYVILISFGFIFFDDFSEHFPICSIIYFGIDIFNFFCLKWKDGFIADFIVEKNLNFLFIFLSFIYLAVLVISFLKADGVDRM